MATAACVLAGMVGSAVGGALIAQKYWSSTPALAAAPVAAGPKLAAKPVVTVTDVTEPSVVKPAETAAKAPEPPANIPEPPVRTPEPPAKAPEPPIKVAAATPPPPAPPPAESASADRYPTTRPILGQNCPGNPNAIGVSRVVEIDTTGGPGFGFEHFKNHDFLRQGEVVLTFDDGPWPKTTPAVLAALAAHCTKAIFFPIGKHATYEPGILKQVAAAGHAVGSHTWGHIDLSKKTVEEGKEEIEKGISAVRWAVGGPTAPYFRFPALKHPPELVTYLGERGIGIFSTDFDSFDFKMRKPDQVRQSVMAKLKKHGKGIALMHDFQAATAEATAGLLGDLKAGGYKIVFMVPRYAAKTIAAYDELLHKEMKLPTVDQRPTSTVVRTIGE
jgi:peptidoglycan/xylan/chitin deacetylase (PgdA/CDA1 family)